MKSVRAPSTGGNSSKKKKGAASSGSSGASNSAVASQMTPTSSSLTPMLDSLADARAPRRDDTVVSNPELTDKDSAKFKYEQHEGEAFLKGSGDQTAVDQEDINQGSLGDCYWMAGMAAVAQAQPQLIEKLIKDNGDGTYSVTLYEWGQEKTVVVDNKFPTRSSGGLAYADKGATVDNKAELWPALLEKAWAVMKSGGQGTGYADIEGGLPGKAMTTMTGDRSDAYDPRRLEEDDILLMVEIALEEKQPGSCATLVEKDIDDALKKLFDEYGYYACHCYTFYGVDLDARTLKLRNPWGSSHPKDIPVDVFKKCFDVLDINRIHKEHP